MTAQITGKLDMTCPKLGFHECELNERDSDFFGTNIDQGLSLSLSLAVNCNRRFDYLVKLLFPFSIETCSRRVFKIILNFRVR